MNQFKPYKRGFLTVFAYQSQEKIVLNSSKGEIRVEQGDYIVRGPRGEIYPFKPEMFHSFYKPTEKE